MSEPSLLILDDDQHELEGIRSYAKSLGYEIVKAESPQEAHTCNTAKNAEGAHFTVMIVDLQLGQDPSFRGGWEFLEKAELNDATVVVVMTKHADVHKHSVPLKVARRGLWTFKLKHDPDDQRAVRKLLADQTRGAARDQTLVAESPSDLAILDDLPQIAASGLPVLITGESGSSKELYARAIADLMYTEEELESVRDLVVVDNCAGLTDELAMSQLFGHCRGAFTDATENRVGLVLRASGYASLEYHPANRTTPMEPPDDRSPGTLILDEIAELRPRVQAMLLRALDKYPVKPVGDTGPGFKPNFRVIGLTNAEDKGCFRRDLLGRLNGYHIKLPSIAERPETARGIVEREATSFRMLRPPEHLPQAIISVSGQALEVVKGKLDNIEYGARELIAWTHRACVFALWKGHTTLTAEHMEEAWKRRVELAGNEPKPSGADEHAFKITDEIRTRAVIFRKELVSLFAEEGQTLNENWDCAKFRRAYTSISSTLAARIRQTCEDLSTGTDPDKLVLITTFQQENRTREENLPCNRRISKAIDYIRSQFKRQASNRSDAAN